MIFTKYPLLFNLHYCLFVCLFVYLLQRLTRLKCLVTIKYQGNHCFEFNLVMIRSFCNDPILLGYKWNYLLRQEFLKFLVITTARCLKKDWKKHFATYGREKRKILVHPTAFSNFPQSKATVTQQLIFITQQHQCKSGQLMQHANKPTTKQMKQKNRQSRRSAKNNLIVRRQQLIPLQNAWMWQCSRSKNTTHRQTNTKMTRETPEEGSN